jgi:hypothetical protein
VPLKSPTVYSALSYVVIVDDADSNTNLIGKDAVVPDGIACAKYTTINPL